MYASMVHCIPATEACRSLRMEGRATLSTVLSRLTISRLMQQIARTSMRCRRLSSGMRRYMTLADMRTYRHDNPCGECATMGRMTTLAPPSMLTIGPHTVQPPVVLAPMAGITNAPFRTLCREFSGGKGLFVSEMITTRALVERNEKTMQLIHFDETETPRSIQLYGVDPVTVGKAVRMIVDEDLRRPHRPELRLPGAQGDPQGRRLGAPVQAEPAARDPARGRRRTPGDLPVTMKMRKGIDDDHITYLDAGRIAVEEGVTAIALHGRTAAQHYGGTADWDAIARLKEHVPEIPVLGNGDIWSRRGRAADDARDGLRRRGRGARLPGAAVAVRRSGGGLRGAAPRAIARPRCARSRT